MKKLEIEARNIDEAKLKAFQQGITVIFDATWWWRRNGKPDGEELLTFIIKYLKNRKAFENEGVGVIITSAAPHAARVRAPYKLYKSPRQVLVAERVCEIRKKSNDEVIGTTKYVGEAIQLAKELIQMEQEDLYGKFTYKIDRNEFELKYMPGSKYRLGQYIVFGVEDADVRASKRKRRNYV